MIVVEELIVLKRTEMSVIACVFYRFLTPVPMWCMFKGGACARAVDVQRQNGKGG